MANEDKNTEAEALENTPAESVAEEKVEEKPVEMEKAVGEEAIAEKAKVESSDGDKGPSRDDDRPERSHRPEKKRFFYTKKVCKFCTGQIDEKHIDYKNIDVLRRYVMPSGKIVPRRITGNCARHQRMVTREIKKARILAFLPYVDR